MEKESKNYNHKNWNNDAENELYTSEWLGAIIRYLFFLGKKNFNELHKPNQLKKNVIIGWLLKVILLSLTIIIFIILS